MSFIGDIFSGDKGAGYTGAYAPIMTPDQLQDRNNTAYNQGQGISADQAALAQALLAQSQGLGPNPAAAALQQATNQNQAMTAGTIAATKGINPALAARQAALAGSQIQQGAAAQGAQMQAQQQIAARNQLTGLYGQQANQNLSQQQIQQGAIDALNRVNVANQAQKSGGEAQVAVVNSKKQGDIFSDLMGAASKGINLGASALGGGAPKVNGTNAYESSGGGNTGSLGSSSGGPGVTMAPYAQGGEVPSFHSYMTGGKVAGKPEVPGKVDTQKNDKVKALLSPGEIVIPRSISMSENAAEEAAAFVRAIKAKSTMGK